MKIVPFAPRHLEEAGKITLSAWGGEVPWIPEVFRPLLYHYLVRYYWDRNSPHNYAAEDADGRLKAFLLASAKHAPDVPEAERWMQERLPQEFETVYSLYRAYLDGNRMLELQHARAGEVVLALFASSERGCGKLLMETLERACREQNAPSILLWTDGTCDFAWYGRHGFEDAGCFRTNPSPPGLSLETLLFRKKLL